MQGQNKEKGKVKGIIAQDKGKNRGNGKDMIDMIMIESYICPLFHP
jgi:hypothetical protein